MDLTRMLNEEDEAGSLSPRTNPHSPVPSSEGEKSQASSISPPASGHASPTTFNSNSPISEPLQDIKPETFQLHLSRGIPGLPLPPIMSVPALPIRGPGRPSCGDPSTKAFPCGMCPKKFARRSDLARHERIHTGIRPHVCDWPGCHKEFIQRSALTVHFRVHTGEKPHLCETCGKPFSDSSSLARHRRIHSGKRPYKCPYADCQKTFTRRTTLTRHQSSHTGTLSESEAATAAALAARPSLPRPGRPPRSPPYQRPASEGSSTTSTPSPHQRSATLSPIGMSPIGELPPALPLHPPTQGWTMPWQGRPHELQPLTPRATPTSTPPMPSVPVPSKGSYRSAPTSHPAQSPSILPSLPEILDCSKTETYRHSSPHVSRSISPHFSNQGYHSPIHSGPSSQSGTADQFNYQSPGPYYQQPSPRPGSSGSIDLPFDRKSRVWG